MKSKKKRKRKQNVNYEPTKNEQKIMNDYLVQKEIKRLKNEKQ